MFSYVPEGQHVCTGVLELCWRCAALAVVPQIHQSVRLELLPTQRALSLWEAYTQTHAESDKETTCTLDNYCNCLYTVRSSQHCTICIRVIRQQPHSYTITCCDALTFGTVHLRHSVSPTLVLHHSVMHSQQKRCPHGVEVECLLSSRQRMQRAALGPELCVCWGLKIKAFSIKIISCHRALLILHLQSPGYAKGWHPCLSVWFRCAFLVHMHTWMCSALTRCSAHGPGPAAGPVPEVPVQLPLLPGSLPLSEVVELETQSDEQLKQGQDAQQPVAAPDGPVVTVEPHHTQLHTWIHRPHDMEENIFHSDCSTAP